MNYVDMCNEVLVRMREREIVNVNSADNDPQQKIVTKFVKDAVAFVERAHTWNSSRKLWVIDLAHDVYKYTLRGCAEQSSISFVKYDRGGILHEVSAGWMSSRGRKQGTPGWYAPSHVNDHSVEMHVWPRPDNTFHGTGDIFEYTVGQFGEASFASPEKQLFVYGYGKALPLKESADPINLPDDPVLHYALAYAQRERGEAGGQNSQETFALAKQYLSDAIAWDVNNSRREYEWVTT
jgi:hypothetical protein